MLNYLTTLDFSGIAKTVIGAGIIAACIQLAVQGLRDRHSRTSHATYLAMRLASDLESFVVACAIRVGENENAEQAPDDQYPSWNLSIPALSDFPLEVEGWRYLDRHLADRCLRLRNEIQLAKSLIEMTAEHLEEELGDEAIERVSKLGLDAWAVASSLRSRYGLGHIDLVSWDYPGGLKIALASVTNRRAKERDRQKVLWQDIQSSSE